MGAIDVAGVKYKQGGVALQLHHEVEQFFFHEAELLDSKNFRGWLDLLDESIDYIVRTRSNVDSSSTSSAYEPYVAHDTKQTLTWRVNRVETGMAWAEEPPSRTRYLITNIRVRAAGDDLISRGNFVFYRNRLETTEHFLIGCREDTLRIYGEGKIRIVRRLVTLDQNVILANNLSMLF
jgi:3-phenylpropionate/cinnamic acid dioxygenase small subunit